MASMRAILSMPSTPEEEAAFDELAERLAFKLAPRMIDDLAPRLADALDSRPLLSIPKAAAYCGFSDSKMYALVKEGRIATVQIGEQQRIEHRELDRFVASCRDGEEGR